MSRVRRRGRRPSIVAMHDALEPFTERQTPGGCDDCDAFQTVQLTAYGVRIAIHHDDWCPIFEANS